MRRITREGDNWLNRIRRNDVKDAVKNIMGDIFHWPDSLTVSALTVSPPTVTKIEETPVTPAALTLNVPSATIITGSTSVKNYTEISGVTISIASPCVVTKAGHGIVDHEIIKFTTTGVLPTGLAAFAYYYCDYVDADTFRITSAIGGANINTSGSQSGTQSVWHET